MKANEVQYGAVVRVRSPLSGVGGMLCLGEHLDNRREDAVGRIFACLTQESNQTMLVFVRHGDTEAVYWAHELEMLGTPTS